MYLEFDKTHRTDCHRVLITPKLFVFFYSSSLACLLPFLPVFFRINGMSAVQNGFLVAARYLVLFWAAPTLSFLASKINSRKTILVLAVLLGAIGNTSFLFTADYQVEYKQGCLTVNANQTSFNQSTGYLPKRNATASGIKPNEMTNYQNKKPHNNNSRFYFQVHILRNKRNRFQQEIFNTIGLTFDKKFLIFLLIVALGTIVSSPAKPLHEMVTLDFCFHILFSTTTVIFGVLMKSPVHKTTPKVKLCRILKLSYKNSNIIVVLITMAILGTAQSIHSSYLFWYIMDLGGTELHMGLILLVSGLSQIPLLFATKYLIHWLGHGWIFFLGLSAFAGRFCLYSFIAHPVMVIPIEILHCLTSSSIWLTSMSVAVLVAPIGLEKSLQNLFTASYYGIGMGFGGVLTSIVYQLYGPVIVFQYAAAVCAVYAVVLAVLQCLISPPDENQVLPINGDYYKVGVNASNQSDWLLDALNAEEEEIQYTR